MEKINVLIADDVISITNTYKSIISQNEKFNIVYIANNGEDEYNKILEFKPQIVITDNEMPKLNGIEVIEKINNSDLKDKPYFIVISGDSNHTFLDKCMQLGVYRLFGKPISKDSLLYCLDEIYDIFNEDEEKNKNDNNLKSSNKAKKGFLKFFGRGEE